MVRWAWAAGAAALAGLASAQADDAVRTFAAEDVFNLELAADPRVSPDGSVIAYVRTSMDKMRDRARGAIWLIDVRDGRHRPLIVGPGSYSAPRWSPDGERLAYMASENGETTLKIWWRADDRSVTAAAVEETPSDPAWSPDGAQVAFTMFTPSQAPKFADPPARPEGAEWSEPVRVFDDIQFRFDGRGYLREGAEHVYVVPAEGGTPRQVTSGAADFSDPAWLDADTLLVVGNEAEDADLDPIESEIFAVDLASLERTALTSRDGPDHAPLASPDGRRIAYLGYDDEVVSHQIQVLSVMNADGGDSRAVTEDLDRHIRGFAWSPNGRRLIVMVENEGEVELQTMGLDGLGVDVIARDVGGATLGRPYATGAFTVGGSGPDGVIAYTRSQPLRPADVGVIVNGGQPRTLTNLNEDALGDIALAEIEEIQVPSTVDGATIEAWVAKPPGHVADGTAPMILEIHGGPFAMYGPFFSAEVQRFAAEGYVTVYANPRGSTGYGEAFAREIDLAYPGEDAVDLVSVVDFLVARGDVDPDRLFVTGGSGGGVLTSWLVGTTDKFAGAATVKPVINWMTMALSADIAAYVRRHWIREDPWENPEAYWELSPISKVGNVSTPTLVMVGEEDWRTPTWEAEQFYTALKLRGVDTALIRIPGASHAIASRPSRLIAKVDNIMGWFAAHDPGADAVAETEEGPAATGTGGE